MPPSNDPAALVERWNAAWEEFVDSPNSTARIMRGGALGNAGDALAAALEQQVRRVEELTEALRPFGEFWNESDALGRGDCAAFLRRSDHQGAFEITWGDIRRARATLESK